MFYKIYAGYIENPSTLGGAYKFVKKFQKQASQNTICLNALYLQNSAQEDTHGAKDDRQENSKIPTPNKVCTCSALILEYDFIHFTH
jgi:hypothetical protein